MKLINFEHCSYKEWLDYTECPIKIEYSGNGGYFNINRLHNGKYNKLFMIVLSNLQLAFPPVNDPKLGANIGCRVIDRLPEDADETLSDMYNSIITMKIVSDLYLTTMHIFKKDIIGSHINNIVGNKKNTRKSSPLSLNDIQIEDDDFIFKEKEIQRTNNTTNEDDSPLILKHVRIKLLTEEQKILTVCNDNVTGEELEITYDNINSYFTKGSKIMVFLNLSTVSFVPSLSTLFLSNKAFQIYVDTERSIINENDKYDILRNNIMKSKTPLVFNMNENDCNTEEEENRSQEEDDNI